MHNHDYRNIVSRSETQALKEMIFNRARQRAEALTQDTQQQYTSNFKNEIMEIARNSFNAPGNPFSDKIVNQNHAGKQTANAGRQEEIGFPQKINAENIKEIIKERNSALDRSIANNEIMDVMQSSEISTDKSKNFVGALAFLNAQAGLQLAEQRKSKFEAIA